MLRYHVMQIWNKVSKHTEELQSGYIHHTERAELAIQDMHRDVTVVKGMLGDTKAETLTHLANENIPRACEMFLNSEQRHAPLVRPATVAGALDLGEHGGMQPCVGDEADVMVAATRASGPQVMEIAEAGTHTSPKRGREYGGCLRSSIHLQVCESDS